jgi:cell division protein FtsQ
VNRPARKRDRKPLFRLRHVLAVMAALTVSAAVLFACVVVYNVITHYKGFNAKKVTVFGASRLNDEAVLSQAGVKTGDNIFHVNLSVVRQRLLAHPWIEYAEVTREIPGSLMIKIKEHEPQAIVELNNRYLMNTEGDVYKHFKGDSGEVPDGIPVIMGFSPEDIQVAGRQTMNKETNPHKAVMNIIRIAKVPDSSLPLSKIRQILVDREIGLTLLTSGNIRTVKLGYGDYEEKVRRLGEVSKFLKEKARLEEIDTLDLLNLERIVVKPATSHRTA